MIRRHFTSRTLALVVTLAAAGSPATAQGPAGSPVDPSPGAEVSYDVAFPNAVHHEVRVSVTFDGLAPGQPLEALMSRASPGRYALHEFAKNVYRVSAVDGAGRPLQATRPSPYEWDFAGHDGTVTVSYTVFANHADGTYAGVDSTHAHFNMPAAFMYARGLERRPIRITFHPIHGWKIATQLQRTADPDTYLAPDLQYFMDSPTELSDHQLLEWDMGPGGKAHYRMSLHHTGTDAEGAAYVEKAKKVIAEEAAVFGEYPAFDYGNYTFLADYLPWVFGDGMEHRNSTIISNSRSLRSSEMGLLGTLAHEHFHAWNMERLRDDAIEPFAFQRANMSSNLWFGEGFTSYYDGLVRVRAGFMSLDDYAGDMTGTLNYVIGSPSRDYRGPADMSRMAPFVDAASAIDETNFGDTFVSYYSWGEALGFGLDLLLRERFDRSLDDYMRAMWREYGSHQDGTRPARPYDRQALERVLGEVTGDRAFAADFFDRYVDHGQVLDYATLVEPAGLVLRPAHPDHGWLGAVSLRPDSGGARVVRSVAPGTAAAEAGLASGDLLVSVDGVPAASAEAVSDALADRHPGDVVTLVFEQTGARRTARATLQPDPRLELATFEAAGRTVTAAIRSFRRQWLDSKAGAR